MAKKKRILKEILINEISAVDRPAQPGALATIMKRHDPKDRKVIGKNVKMTTAYDGHQHVVDMVGWEGEHLYGGMTSWVHAEGDDEGHSHPWTYDKKGGLVIGEALGHKHEIAEISKTANGTNNGEPIMAKKILKSALATALLTSTAIAKFDPDTAHAEDADLIKAAAKDFSIMGMLPDSGPLAIAKGEGSDDDDEEKKKMKEDLEKYRAIADMSRVEKAHYDTLDGDDKSAFAKMDKSGREQVISKASDADPIEFTSLDGTVFRKSAGDLVIKQARKIDDMEKELAKSRKDALDTDISKRADALDKLPGSADVKKAVVGALLDIKDEKIQKQAFEMLEASNSANSGDFEGQGSFTKADASAADTKLEKMAKAYASENSVTYAQAYVEVTKSGEGASLYKALRTGATEQ